MHETFSLFRSFSPIYEFECCAPVYGEPLVHTIEKEKNMIIFIRQNFIADNIYCVINFLKAAFKLLCWLGKKTHI